MSNEIKGLSGNNILAAGRGVQLDQARPMPGKPPAVQPATTEKIKESATQFEAMLLQQMFKSMWSGVPSEGMLSGGREEEYYRDMFNEALANSVASGQGLGIKDIIAKEMAKSAATKDNKENR
jgi:Rod binding domain-containing protein